MISFMIEKIANNSTNDSQPMRPAHRQAQKQTTVDTRPSRNPRRRRMSNYSNYVMSSLIA